MKKRDKFDDLFQKYKKVKNTESSFYNIIKGESLDLLIKEII